MQLFSEIYNSYYQILCSLLQSQQGFSLEKLRSCVTENGFEESLIYLVPKLESKEWSLCKREGDCYLSTLSNAFYVPLSQLQKSYIKTILSDMRINLFLDKEQQEAVLSLLEDADILWKSDNFHYYDQFLDGDDYTNENYITNFRTLLQAIKEQRLVDVTYRSKTNGRIHHHYLPARLEYSVKNDKFRLISIAYKNHHFTSLEILNLDRIETVTPMEKTFKATPDLNKIIQKTYYREPVRLIIQDERNALERAMLQFANYEKNTTRLSKNKYECLIYYNLQQETELLIEVLSFGPMLQVTGNERFLQQLKKRLSHQKQWLHPSNETQEN